MTAGDTDPGVSQQRAHSGCRARSAPVKGVGVGQGPVTAAQERGAMAQPREDGLCLTAPTNKPSSRIQGWREKAARACPGPGRKAARGQRMQEPPSRCGTRGRTVPSSSAEHGSGAPTSPSCREWRVHGLSSVPTAAFCRKQPISTALPPHPPGETALLRGLLLPSWDAAASPPLQSARTPAWSAGQGWNTAGLGHRSSLMRNGGPQHAQAAPLGWGLSSWASTAQAPSLLRPDPFVPGSIVTAETGGAGQPSSARAQQMGLPGPLPAAHPRAVTLHPGCSLQPPAERHQSCLPRAHTVPGTVSVPLTPAMAWLEHPLMAANLPLAWGHPCQGAKSLPLEQPLLE